MLTVQLDVSNEGVASCVPAISNVLCLHGSNLPFFSSPKVELIVDWGPEIFSAVVVIPRVDVDNVLGEVVEAAIIPCEYLEFRADNSLLLGLTEDEGTVVEGSLVDSSRKRVAKWQLSLVLPVTVVTVDFAVEPVIDEEWTEGEIVLSLIIVVSWMRGNEVTVSIPSPSLA